MRGCFLALAFSIISQRNVAKVQEPEPFQTLELHDSERKREPETFFFNLKMNQEVQDLHSYRKLCVLLFSKFQQYLNVPAFVVGDVFMVF